MERINLAKKSKITVQKNTKNKKQNTKRFIGKAKTKKQKKNLNKKTRNDKNGSL